MNPRGVAAAGIQSAVNRLLALDPEFAEGLAELEGTVLEVHLQGLDERLRLYPQAAGVRVEAVNAAGHGGAEPDVTISGPPFTLLRLLGSLHTVDGVLPEEISVSGELAIVQKLTALARRARFDWEEPLARLLGDTVAYELGRGARAVAAHVRAAADTLSADIGEYLREERRLSPTQLEVDDFADAVDRTRDDVERLEVRVARLARRARGPRA